MSNDEPALLDLAQNSKLLAKHIKALDIDRSTDLLSLLRNQVQYISQQINLFPEKPSREAKMARNAKQDAINLLTIHVAEMKRSDHISWKQLNTEHAQLQLKYQKLEKKHQSLKEKYDEIMLKTKP